MISQIIILNLLLQILNGCGEGELDIDLTGDPNAGAAQPAAGDWVLTMNLGFGF